MRNHVLALMCVDGITAGIYYDLVSFYGSAEQVLHLPGSELKACPLLTEKMAENIHYKRYEDCVAYVNKKLTACSANFICVTDDAYPMLLRQIHQPPPVLYYKGRIDVESDFSLAVVGSRNPDDYGKRIGREIAEGIAAAGIPIVSGLAKGIDAISHVGALSKGVRTVAVLGTAIQHVYPKENKALFDEIEEKGCILTEIPVDETTYPVNFVNRNRIISGLSRGVVVVQAAHKSGAITTALFANEQNRDVFAVPGDIYKGLNNGCHRLLRLGAKLVESPNDVLNEYPELSQHNTAQMNWLHEQAGKIKLDNSCQKVLDRLDRQPKHVDVLIEDCDLSRAQIMTAILNLELKNYIQRHPGNYFTRKV